MRKGHQWSALPALTIMLVLGACTGGGNGVPALPSSANGTGHPAEMLVLETTAGVEALDPATGSVLFNRSGVAGMPDWSKLFTAVPSGGSTHLREVDPRTGNTVSSVHIGGRFVVRTVSGDGRAVALTAPTQGSGDPWTPVDRPSTTIVVAHLDAQTKASASEPYRLHGNFAPEAFSSDDRSLFMIEYLPAVDPVAYRVTSLSLRHGKVHPVYGRTKATPPPERMTGTRLQQLRAPDGSQLYTLYTDQPPRYAKGYSAQADMGSRPVAFIHTLNLQQGWAYCLDLPRAFGPGPASAKAIALSPDGSRLYAIDATRGLIAVMDTASLNVVRTERVPLGLTGSGQTVANVGADGRTLYVARGSQVVTIDTGTFTTTARWSLAAPANGLAPSADGKQLYATTSNDLLVLDPTTGHRLRSIPVSGVSGIDYLGTRVG